MESYNFPFALWEWNRVSDILVQGISIDSFRQTIVSLAEEAHQKGCLFGGLVVWTEGRELHFDLPQEVDWEGNVFISQDAAQKVLHSLHLPV